MSDVDSDWGPDWVEDKVEGVTGLVPLVKAHFIGQDVADSNVRQPEERIKDQDLFEKSGVIPPPYDPSVLCKLWEHSNSLRQNIDAYVVNIDGFGHHFEPVIDLEADEAFDQVRDAIFLERLTEGEDLEVDRNDVIFPSDAEVNSKIDEMTDSMRLEKSKLDAFFRFCCIDESFVSLRKKVRQDKEVMGNGFWEVLRNGAGEPAQFTYIPGFSVRLLPLERNAVPVIQKVKRSPLTVEEIEVRKRFRRFVQVFEGRKMYYKEFGDPRVVSAKTGAAFEDHAAMKAEEASDGEDILEATEILHFPIHSPRSPYGIPRWTGVLLAVLGSRQSEEVNFLYFENKSVPPMALLVSGGRLSTQSVKKVESFIENRIKGRSNFHKILVIEGETMGGALDPASGSRGGMKIEIVPLTHAQQSDALFQNYDERNIDKVGMSFRLPRLLRGDIRDFNRATAEAAIEFAETQVFGPEREDFDWTINRKLLSDLGVRFWTFESNSPTTRNPIDLAKIVAELVKSSILTPEEARELAKGIFNRDFKKIDELWTKIPPELLKAGILPGADASDFELEPEPEEEPEIEDDPTIEKSGDVSTADLKNGGEKVAGQHRKKKGFVKIPQPIGKRYKTASRRNNLRKLAVDLVDLRNTLNEEEQRAASKEHSDFQKAEIERETITLSSEDFAALVGPQGE